MDHYDINLSLPDLSRVEVEWTRLKSSIPEVWKFNNDGREFEVGEAIRLRGLSAKYPVVLIPGIVSTVCRLLELRFEPLLIQSILVVGIVVYEPRVPSVFQRKTLGRVQHAFPCNVQQRKMDKCDDARS